MLTIWDLKRRAYAHKSRLATLQCYALCERVTEVNHNTVIRWVMKSVIALPDAPQVEEISEITEIDELQTFGFAKPPAGYQWESDNAKRWRASPEAGCRNANRVC